MPFDKLPEMIMFDYGGTLLYEPGFDFMRGERALFEHVISNPNHATPEQSRKFSEQLFKELQSCRDINWEPHEYQMMRLQYEYLGIKFDVSWQEAEQILWDYTSPLVPECKMPYVEEMLKKLKSLGIRTGVISNIGWSGENLHRRMNLLLPNNQFEFILASSEYGVRKPDRRIFELGLKKAGLEPDEVWFCGDTYEADVVGAYQAGITPILYEGLPEGKEAPMRQTVPENNQQISYRRIQDWRDLL